MTVLCYTANRRYKYVGSQSYILPSHSYRMSEIDLYTVILLTNNINGDEILIYQTENGDTRIEIRMQDETIWLTQAQMAELFQKDRNTISEHINNIYKENELAKEATTRNFRSVQTEGNRGVSRDLSCYNLDVIISVGYRVKSTRGTQFRIWATQCLKEYLVKGFVMDDARLKEPGGWDYFEELLERIRDIRTSEKRFYQKVRDIPITLQDANNHRSPCIISC